MHDEGPVRAERPRFETLDIVRTVAASAVVLFHARLFGLDYGPLDGLVGSLDLAVFAFFSLSGYLVFRPFATGQVSARVHVIRRLFRIFPAYLVAVAAALWLTGSAATRGHELEFALILQGLDSSLALPVMPVAWSLHVEVVFYLVLPVLVLMAAAIGGRSHRRRAAVIATLGLLSLGARVAVTSPDQTSFLVIGRYAPLMLWAFVPGMLVAYAMVRSSSVAGLLTGRRTWTSGICLIVVAVAAMPNDRSLVELARMVMVTVGTALLIPRLLSLHLPGRAATAAAQGGRCLSYPVYLWHVTVMAVLVSMGVKGWPGLAIAVAAVLVLSIGSWLFVERPAIRGAKAITDALERRSFELSAPSVIEAGQTLA